MGKLKNLFKKKGKNPKIDYTSSYGGYQGPVKEGTSETLFRTTGKTTETKENLVSTATGTDSSTLKPKSSGSRSSSGGSSNIPVQTTPVQSLNFQGTNLNQSVISPAVPDKSGIAAAYNYWKYNRQNQTLLNALKGTYQIATENINRNKTNVINQQSQDLQAGVRNTNYYGSGTTQRVQVKYTDEEVSQLAEAGKVSQQAALNELARREAERYGNERNFYLQMVVKNVSTSAQKDYGNLYNVLKEQVNKGMITPDKANELLKQEADRINSNMNNQITSSAEKWSAERGQEMEQESYVFLNKVSDKIAIKKTLMFAPVIIGAGVAVGAGGVALASLGAGAAAGVQAAGIAGTTAAVYGTGKNLYNSYKQGTLNAGRVGAVILPQLLFIGGASAGVKITGRSINARQTEILQNALNRGEVVTTSSKAITTELQLTALKIPENAKAEILGKARGSNSIRVSEYEVRGTNPNDEAVINKYLPTQRIKFVEVLDGQGKVINRIAVGQISVGSGKKTYRENVLQVGSGVKVGNNFVMDTISFKVPENKGITQISKTRDIIKSKQKIFMEDDFLKRLSAAKSYSFQGIEINAPKGKQVNYNDLMEVAQSEKFNRIPKSYSEIKELQKASKFRELNIGINKEGNLNSLGLNLKEIDFITEGGKGISKNIIKPFEFTREPTTNLMKTFSPEKANIKNVEIPKVNQALKQLNKDTAGLFSLSESKNLKGKIKESVSFGAEKIMKSNNKQKSFLTGLEQSNVQLFPKQINALSDTSFLNMNALKELNITQEKNSQKKKVINRSKSASSFAITPSQIQSYIQSQGTQQRQVQVPKIKTSQINYPIIKSFYTPYIKIPQIKIPNFDIFSGTNLKNYPKINYNQLTKKQKQPSSKYTASLLSASFPTKPMKVTRKQLQRLNKRVFSGAENRPVLQLIPDKEEIQRLDFSSFENSKKGGVQF